MNQIYNVTNAFADAGNPPSQLVGVPCPQVQTAIVSQMKVMGSYKLGPVTPTCIQANHTSAVGQMEAVNFTIIPTIMATGCHIQVRQTHARQVWCSQ
ncbi:hypothetical protein fugu_014752 [Takifugu bimaculatus]|uniref:Uncharacterized protein n=1 Tax=Takifugu bimaculatus TaxID=433685 RepID=A0A4Z2C3W6_9TELE|nr:hypothetical protein fugu_014752 [Takifugu bimaculatus]